MNIIKCLEQCLEYSKCSVSLCYSNFSYGPMHLSAFEHDPQKHTGIREAVVLDHVQGASLLLMVRSPRWSLLKYLFSFNAVWQERLQGDH